MSLFLLPCKVRKINDALRMNFIWQGNKDNKAIRLVIRNTLITVRRKEVCASRISRYQPKLTYEIAMEV